MSSVNGGPTSRGRPTSSFRLVHATMLIAATAGGLAFGRPFWRYVLWGDYAYLGVADAWLYAQPVSGRDPVKYWVVAALLYGQPFLASWTFALIPMRLMHPRPPRRRLAGQPGMTAACATAVGLFYYYLASVPEIYAVSGPHRFYESVRSDLCYGRWAECIAPAILVAWSISALGGNWKPEAGWIDRLGRLLAFAWLLMAAAAHTIAFPWTN